MPSPDRLIAGLLALACTAGIVSCIPGVRHDPRLDLPAAPPSASARLVTQGKAVAGPWDIVEFNGYEPRRLTGSTRAAFADFEQGSVSLRIECNRSDVSGKIERGVFVASPSDGVRTLIGCGREREARDAALFDFFESRPTVFQLPDGRLLLTSEEGELLLERPGKRRLAFLPSARELMGEWRPTQLSRLVPGRGYAAIGLSEVPGQVRFDGIEAAFDGCPELSLRYRLTAQGRIEKIGGAALPAAGLGCGALRDQIGRQDMPQPRDMIRVLHADPMVEKIDDDTLLVSTDQIGLMLERME